MCKPPARPAVMIPKWGLSSLLVPAPVRSGIEFRPGLIVLSYFIHIFESADFLIGIKDNDHEGKERVLLVDSRFRFTDNNGGLFFNSIHCFNNEIRQLQKYNWGVFSLKMRIQGVLKSPF